MAPGGRVRALVPPELGYTSSALQPQPPTFATKRQLANHAREPLLFEVWGQGGEGPGQACHLFAGGCTRRAAAQHAPVLHRLFPTPLPSQVQLLRVNSQR